MSQSFVHLDKVAARTRATFRQCYQCMIKTPKELWSFISTSSVRLWCGELDEEETVVLRTNVWFALLRCWPHFVTLGATVALAYLNIAGYFVGALLQGDPSRNYQAFYQLCLQVTAKILVNPYSVFPH